MELEVARTLADLVSVDAMVVSHGSIIHTNALLERRLKEERGWGRVEGHHVSQMFEREHRDQVREWYEELRERDDRFGTLRLRPRGEGASSQGATLIALCLEDRELILLSSPGVRPVKEQMRELETTARMFRNYLREGGLGLMVLQDGAGREALIRYINQEGATILERRVEELNGMSMAAFMAEGERDRVLQLYRERLGGKTVDAHKEVQFITPGGQTLLIDVVVGLTTWEDNPAVYVLFRDETERLRLFEELRRFAQGFDMLKDTLVLTDRDFNTIYINPTGLKRSGYDQEEVLGKSAELFATFDEGDVDLPGTISELLERGHWTGELMAVTKGGDRYPVEISASVTTDERGDPEMIAVHSRDITERKEAEHKLLQAREQAEFFTDLMCHDINNYIQAVIGFLDLLARKELDDEQRGHLDRALEQSSRVSELIERVREISKAQHPHELKPVDLVAIIDEALGDLRDRYPDVDIDVGLDTPGGPVPVMADDLLKDLVLNLLDNAVKYCDQDDVVVEVEVVQVTDAHAPRAILTVADRGPGIVDEDKESIFYRFVRRAEDAEGSGLGLSLVMALTFRYGGTVRVEDRVPGDPSHGATFVVELPSA